MGKRRGTFALALVFVFSGVVVACGTGASSKPSSTTTTVDKCTYGFHDSNGVCLPDTTTDALTPSSDPSVSLPTTTTTDLAPTTTEEATTPSTLSGGSKDNTYACTLYEKGSHTDYEWQQCLKSEGITP